MSNLNAAFQRLTQDPKSKQKESGLIYDIVTLNHTILSAIASIGSYTVNNHTTRPSEEFDTLIAGISTCLKNAASLLVKSDTQMHYKPENMKLAQEKLLKSYDDLSQARDKDIEAGFVEIDSDFLLHLREAHLITNQLIWLKTLSNNLQKATFKYKAIFSKS